MATGTVSFRYFILGLLTRQSMSGYDVKQFISGFRWLIGSPSSGSLYPALRALLQGGLVTVDVIPSQDKPPRKVYSITDAGVQALQEWIDRPAVPDAPLRAFLMRLILAGNFTRAALIGHLKQRHSQVVAHQTVLEQMAGQPDERTDLGQRLALVYGLAIARAERDCVRSMLEQLIQEPLPEEVIQIDRVTDAI